MASQKQRLGISSGRAQDYGSFQQLANAQSAASSANQQGLLSESPGGPMLLLDLHRVSMKLHVPQAALARSLNESFGSSPPRCGLPVPTGPTCFSCLCAMGPTRDALEGKGGRRGG